MPRVVNEIVGGVAIPAPDQGWRETLTDRARTARATFTDHSWAIGFLESHPPGAAAMQALDQTLGRMRDAGFSIDDAAHAIWLVDSFVYGHVIQEASFMTSGRADDTSVAAGLTEMAAGALPHVSELGRRALETSFSYEEEFERGIASILDAIDRDLAG